MPALSILRDGLACSLLPVGSVYSATGEFECVVAGPEELVFLVPCHHFEIAPALSMEQLRAEGLVAHRWWTVDELAAMATLAASLAGVRQVNLLPYHKAGIAKFRRFDRPYGLAALELDALRE